MVRYAFIDVLNTSNTTEKMLQYEIDWVKLCDYLKNKKSCTEVTLYTGIDSGDIETAEEFDTLSEISGIKVLSKAIFAYKNKDKIIPLRCPGCKKENIHRIDMGYRQKANCDVELSVDVIEKASKKAEFLIFTGDGDFEYLIRKALEKGVNRVTIFSYAGKYVKAGLTISRFSTKLRKLLQDERERVFYTSLRDIENIIRKEPPKIVV